MKRKPSAILINLLVVAESELTAVLHQLREYIAMVAPGFGGRAMMLSGCARLIFAPPPLPIVTIGGKGMETQPGVLLTTQQ
jgi:hypothetical protein